MRNLIGQRPNLVPTGLGHSGTPIGDGVIIPDLTPANDEDKDGDDEHIKQDANRASSVPFEDWEHTPGHTPEPDSRKRTFYELDIDDDGAAMGSGDDYEPSSHPASESVPVVVSDDEDEDDDDEAEAPKTKGKTAKAHRKKPAKPATSKPAAPAAAAAPKPSKKTKIAEFAEIAKEDERTRQKELELATLRTRQQMKATEVKGRYLEKREDRKREEKMAKREEKMAKLRYKELKLIQGHERRMQAARADPLSSTSHAATFFGSSSSSSRYTPSEPDFHQLDSFNGNAMAGPSNSGAQIEYNFNSFDNTFTEGS
ncbi:hypothetical protein MVEN_01154000 [Mycena venus]|uniref:Uncharacterized protein n=1 Tax=Mycena venus TaxID=2733690 RepID=A0A8H6Y508_9AGAR|nr:hypothetical protein MVEN_01154000 [Mycena venus]